MTRSAERRRLQAAIADQPDDQHLRGAYADWLEEHGFSEEARFERLLGRFLGDRCDRFALFVRPGRLVRAHDDWQRLERPEQSRLRGCIAQLYKDNPGLHFVVLNDITLEECGFRHFPSSPFIHWDRRNARPRDVLPLWADADQEADCLHRREVKVRTDDPGSRRGRKAWAFGQSPIRVWA